jgi:hypothetical protein
MPRRLLALLLLYTGCATASHEEVVTRFTAASNRLNVEELRPLLAEEATAFLPMPQSGARVSGREPILAALAPLFEAERPTTAFPARCTNTSLATRFVDRAHLHASNVRP